MAEKKTIKSAKSSKLPANGAELPFARMEQWLSKNSDMLAYWLLGLGIAGALLLFNARILETDDGLYIEGGYKYAQNFFGYYFTSSAALYVMVLAFPIALFGINLFVVKGLSLLFYAAGMYLLYRGFKGRIPNVVFFPAFAITALNYAILSYASLTFTESFFMMLQSLFFLVLLRQLEKDPVLTEKPEKNIAGWLGVGFTLVLLSLTKNIAVAAVGALVLYFLYEKKFKNAVVVIGVYLVFWAVTEALKRLLWGDLIVSQYGGQSTMLMLTNPYDPNSPRETLGGFFNRFYENSQIFLSSRFLEILGLREENSAPDILLTVIVMAGLLTGVVRMILRKEKAITVSAFYSIVLSGATFFALSPSWGQTRYIMIVVPFLLMTIFFGLYDLAIRYTVPIVRMAFVAVTAGLLGLNIVTTLQAASVNFPILQRNLEGDTFAGYPPEWANYLRLSQWCADSLGTDAYVTCRKPAVSFIYGRGKQFDGIYNVPSSDPDTLLNQLKNKGVTHVILDNIAGTVYRYLTIIEKKYPGTFKPVLQVGYEQSAAYLYHINYPKP